MAEEVTYEEIWGKLSKVSVKDHVEEKMGLSYLSWAWAWGVMMEHYPQAEYRFTEYTVFNGESTTPGLDVMQYPDGSCSVECTITIGSCKRTMWLPVMDHRNNAINTPSARQISDTKMRCLVKTIAMFGLGHYLYAGEDLPPEASPEGEAVEEVGEVETAEMTPEKDEAKEEDEASIVHAYSVFSEDQKTMGELKDWCKANLDELKKIEENSPETYRKILNVFSERKRVLLKEEEEGNGK